MFYLIEKLALQVATPKNLDKFVEYASNKMPTAYNKCGADLMASWISSEESLMQITNVFELENVETTQKIHDFLYHDNSNEDIVRFHNNLISEKHWQLYRSVSPKFTEAFHQAIKASQSEPSKFYTVATLQMSQNKMPLLLPNQEAAVDMGMPLIAFMRSLTGKHDEIVDIWKGDLQAAGYQTQDYYESIGMSEEWWDWIRDVAPKEKMVKVSVLPYSPLQ